VAETGALSVWERPTRIAMTGMTLAGAGVVAGLGVADLVVTAGAAVGALLGTIGSLQLGVSLRRMLTD
jgi:CDP-diacylglycerol--glycerol-3-phosphate 3-phosphatidyltransferase